MEDQSIAAVGVDQAILRATPEARDSRARQALPEIDRQRPAQIGAPRLDPLDPPALQDSRQPAHGRFDFGKLRHGGDMAKAGQAR
jgi:hypothetical protein